MYPLVASLQNPIPTEVKRLQHYAERERRRAALPAATQVVIPGLSGAALSRQYGMATAHHPRPMTGTFRVPINISEAIWEGLQLAAVKKFITTIEKQGYEFWPDGRIQVYPGLYPARDLATGYALLDQREMHIRAHFRFKNPQPVRIELPPHLVQPLTI